MVVTACGDIALTGSFTGSLSFGEPADELACAGAEDVFLARFDPEGAHKWSLRFGDAASQEGRVLGSDSDGNLVVAGSFEGTIDFGSGLLTSAGSTDVFVAKLTVDGALVFSRSFGDADAQIPTGVVVDGNYDTILAGAFRGSINFGEAADELVSSGEQDVFVAKLSGEGSHVWSMGFGDGAAQPTTLVTVDKGRNMVLAGSFVGAIDFGGGALASGGLGDVFLAKLATDGTHLWSQAFGDASPQAATAVAVDGDRSVVLAGGFYGTIDLGTSPLASAGAEDIFVARFSP